MSVHASLRGASVLVRHRNVLKRHERIKKLQGEERWEDGRSSYGLPKVRSIKIKVKGGAKKAATDDAADAKGAKK